MISKKVLVLALIVIQALLLLIVVKTGLWRLYHFNTSFRSAWTSWRNDSESIEPEAEVFGLIDLNDQQFSWLNKAARNVSRTAYTYIPAVVTTSTKLSIVKPTSSNSPGSRILNPVVNHEKGEIFVLVLVTTVPKSFNTRELIRNTWASTRENQPIKVGLHSRNVTNATCYVIFMLGRSGDLEQDKALEEEAEEYGDILRGPYNESYRNLITKVWYAFEWAQQYQPKYILKVDDDIYVRIPRFASWLSEGKAPYRLYGGYVHYRAYISRNPKNKHYVNRSEYKKRFFPNYCAGPCYTFSGELLDEFLTLSESVPKFRVEDAYLGLIARKAGVKPFDMGGRLFVWDRSLSRSVHRWTDQRLARVICLGDSLTPDAVKYIHERFLKIDNT